MVTVVVRGTKLTARMLAKALRQVIAAQKTVKMKKGVPKIYRGKQTVKQLVGQNAGVTNIAITDDNIKGFEKVARKYGVDFALKKDASVSPPRWMVFFKSRDADALTAAFSEFSAQTLRRTAARPSVMKTLQKMMELVKNQVVTRSKHREHGGPER